MKPNQLFIIIDSLRSDRFYGENKSCITPRYMLCSNLIIVHAILKAWKLFLWFFWDWKCPKIWYIGYIRIFWHIAHFKDCFKGENDIFDNFDFNHLKSTHLKYNFTIFFLILINMGTSVDLSPYRLKGHET